MAFCIRCCCAQTCPCAKILVALRQHIDDIFAGSEAVNRDILNSRPAPGQPGEVKVLYLTDLYAGRKLQFNVGKGGRGGAGGFALQHPTGEDLELAPSHPLPGASGGGRENDPIINAFVTYGDTCKGTRHEPLVFTEPGPHEAEWPYDTPTATLVVVGAGGGGQGGTGFVLPGGEGEVGGPGAVFLFPTYLRDTALP